MKRLLISGEEGRSVDLEYPPLSVYVPMIRVSLHAYTQQYPNLPSSMNFRWMDIVAERRGVSRAEVIAEEKELTKKRAKDERKRRREKKRRIIRAHAFPVRKYHTTLIRHEFHHPNEDAAESFRKKE